MKKFRLIRSRPAGAVYNMELDKKMFSRYLEDGIPTFRVYGWAKPSFTYGISQHPENELDLTLCSSEGVGVAGRMTGGGVLFHNDEITYSFVCSKEDVGEPKEVIISYREICAFLINFYRSVGIKASFAIELAGFKDKCKPNELCCASYEKYDIVINGKKIGGNAQKRKRSFVFQHGSIPLSIDWGLMRRYLKKYTGNISSGVTALSGELSAVPGKNILEDNLIEAFGKTFCASFVEENEVLYETILAQ